MVYKVIDKVGDKYVYVLDWNSVNLDVLYEINWVEYKSNWVDWGLRGMLWGYYIYGRDSVIIFDMGECGCIKRVIKGVIILY